MAQVFISYRRADIKECEALAAQLENRGYKVWWDRHLPIGKNFAEKIERALRDSDAVVTLWTRKSVQSKWVYFETWYANLAEKLLPLQVQTCEIPSGLAQLQTLQYRPSALGPDQLPDEVAARLEEAIESGRAHGKAGLSLDLLSWPMINASRNLQDVRDFLERFPDSSLRPKAVARCVALQRRNARTALIAWALGLVVYLGLLTPVSVLVAEFGPASAMRWASLYFPFFLFFPIFGLLMTPIYCTTLAKALEFGLSRRARDRARARPRRLASAAWLILAPIVACTLVTLIEVTGGYAPWQFDQATLEAPLNALNPQIADTRSLDAIFDAARAAPISSSLEARNIAPDGKYDCIAAGGVTTNADCINVMNSIQKTMTTRLKSGVGLSMTGKAYAFSFFFFALTFLGTYFNIFYLCLRAKSARAWFNYLQPWNGERYSRILNLFAAQLLFISVWFVAREIFQLQTATVLPAVGVDPSQAIRNAYFLFAAVYAVAIGLVIAAALKLYYWRSRAMVMMFAVATVVFIAVSFSRTEFLRILRNFIGAEATPASIGIFGIVLFFIFLPLVINFQNEDDAGLDDPGVATTEI